MNRQKIHINNLKIRLPHGMAGDAERIAAGFGGEVMRSIAGAAKGKTGSIRIDEISGGKFSAKAGMGEIQKQVGAGVANAAAKKIGGGGK